MAGKRDWKEVNDRLVRRGELYFDLEFLESWDKEVEKMNKGKRGRPFRYPQAFIQWMSLVHTMFFMPFRQMEGFLVKLSRFLPVQAADYTTLSRRICESPLEFDVPLRDDVVIAVDSTGLKVTNRGEWMRTRSITHKGWIKVHIAVDIETKEVLGLEVTKENVTDHSCFNSLVDQSLSKGRVTKVLGDGAYDRIDAFFKLEDHGIEPGIKTKENASKRTRRGCHIRTDATRERRKLGYQGWKEKHGYGKRWLVETAFSTIKRVFGETLTSRKFETMIKEVKTKIAIYNMLINA